VKAKGAAFAVVFVWVATQTFAHRLDEYLQATTFAVEEGRAAVQMRLTPGVQVLGNVLAAIDSNGDGALSAAEELGYADRVRRDLSLTVDGRRLRLRLVSAWFPRLEEMKQGLGDILLNFEADVPPGGPSRRLIFENHHESAISVYLVNCLVPDDPTIRVSAQSRNYNQSFYQLDFMEARTGLVHPPTASSWPILRGWKAQTGDGSLFNAFFYQGIHHILTGYDHLLFVGALVLAARTFWDLVKVVTSFTVGHSITLTLAAFNIVSLPQQVVEPLISASIVVIALQNVFRPNQARGWRRLGAAFFFGLFHGLGFAGGFLEAMHDMQTGTMVLAILAFSIGIEAGHQMVVLPLFVFLRAARRLETDVVARRRHWFGLQRIGSAGISIAGFCYLCLALVAPARTFLSHWR
jgi:hydrogenase/urease accessory protein HupE